MPLSNRGIFGTSLATNLVAYHLSVTNLSPIQKICLGGSTNWSRAGFANYGVSEPPTNSHFDCLAVLFLNTAISASDEAVYYKALNELPVGREHYFMIGDSMVGEDENYVTPFYDNAPWTNFIAFQFMKRHPTALWHDVAQGGTTAKGFIAVPAGAATNLPSDCKLTFISDFPRNDLTLNSAVDFTQISSNLTLTMKPWLTGGQFETPPQFWLYEGPLAATNSDYNRYTALMQSNLITGYLVCRTNPIVNRDLNLIDYWYGSKFDTNNGYYGYGGPGGGFALPGTHIEGANSPNFMQEVAQFWDTGVWPEAAEALSSLPYSSVTGDYSTGYSVTSALATSGLFNTNSAAQISGGTLADARLSANVALLNANQTFTGSNIFIGSSTFSAGMTLGPAGALVKSLRTGSITVGSSSSTNRISVTNSFANAFSTIPGIAFTGQNQAGTSLPDLFAFGVRSITTTNVVINVLRLDATVGWTQILQVNYVAWEP
jgi:hypothetical protein